MVGISSNPAKIDCKWMGTWFIVKFIARWSTFLLVWSQRALSVPSKSILERGSHTLPPGDPCLQRSVSSAESKLKWFIGLQCRSQMPTVIKQPMKQVLSWHKIHSALELWDKSSQTSAPFWRILTSHCGRWSTSLTGGAVPKCLQLGLAQAPWCCSCARLVIFIVKPNGTRGIQCPCWWIWITTPHMVNCI